MNTTKTIELYWADIKYAIDQESWKSAKVQIFGDDKAEPRSDAQVGQNTFDSHYCRRKVEEAVIEIGDVLRKFFVGYEAQAGANQLGRAENGGTAQSSTAENSGDNKLDTETVKWTITFSFDERRKVTAKQLAVEVSKCIVLYVLQEWAKMVMPAMKQEYFDRLLTEEERLKEICYSKEAPEYPGSQYTETQPEQAENSGSGYMEMEIRERVKLEDLL